MWSILIFVGVIVFIKQPIHLYLDIKCDVLFGEFGFVLKMVNLSMSSNIKQLGEFTFLGSAQPRNL